MRTHSSGGIRAQTPRGVGWHGNPLPRRRIGLHAACSMPFRIAGLVAALSFVLIAASPAAALLIASGSSSATNFTFLGPSKWDPGPNTASNYLLAPPDGPMAPGDATWSVMPAGTASILLDPPHNANGDETVGGHNGTVIAGTGSGTELDVYGAMLDVWSAGSSGGFTNLGRVFDSGAGFNTTDPGPGNTIFGDIRIGTIPFDGPGGILAHAFAPLVGMAGSIGGDAHFDSGELWCDYALGGVGCGPGSNGFDFASVVLHELGHSLGLGHSEDPASVMYPFFSPETVSRTLSADDIAGIQAIYLADPTTTLPEPSTALLYGLGLLGVARFGRKIRGTTPPAVLRKPPAAA